VKQNDAGFFLARKHLTGYSYMTVLCSLKLCRYQCMCLIVPVCSGDWISAVYTHTPEEVQHNTWEEANVMMAQWVLVRLSWTSIVLVHVVAYVVQHSLRTWWYGLVVLCVTTGMYLEVWLQGAYLQIANSFLQFAKIRLQKLIVQLIRVDVVSMYTW